MKRNVNLSALQGNYLFPEIARRKRLFLERFPTAPLISLGVGDTTEPLPDLVAKVLSSASAQMSTRSGYSGYGPEQGFLELRRAIASKLYHGAVESDEIFVSDGAKCDIGRLQMLFGSDHSIAVQDPAYPVYVEGSLLQGVKNIVYMPCNPENSFFPDLNSVPRTDLIYFCSPNNPTGAAATKEQLKQLVDFAKQNRSILIYDSAYANFIQDPSLPRSIYEIDGAKEVAIEVGSFSKLAGFTGVRLGWTVVPTALMYEDGGSVRQDWNRMISTIFNGASCIAQHGGVAVLSADGLDAIGQVTRFYLENGKILKDALKQKGLEVFGEGNAPYLWVRFKEKKSWDLFEEFLEHYHLVTTPGVGFGPEGEGFLRFTAFGSRENILEAARRLTFFENHQMDSTRRDEDAKK